jgi:hypothetical protein
MVQAPLSNGVLLGRKQAGMDAQNLQGRLSALVPLWLCCISSFLAMLH